MRALNSIGTWLLSMAALAAPAAHAADVSRYLPADTEVVAFVNVRQLVAAPLVKSRALEPLKAAVKKNADAQHFLTAAGLDPLQDVHGLLIASPGNSSTEKVLVLISGNFNLKKIHEVAAEFAKKNPEQLRIQEQDGQRVYEARSSAQPTSVFILFPDRQTMLLSPSRDYLMRALKDADQKGPRIKKELQALLDHTDSKQSLWLVALVSEDMKKALRASPQTADLAGKITTMTGNILITEDVRAVFQIHTRDARAAQTVERILDGAKGIVKLAALDMENYGTLIIAILDASEITTTKNAVTFTAQISESVIQKGFAKDKK